MAFYEPDKVYRWQARRIGMGGLGGLLYVMDFNGAADPPVLYMPGVGEPIRHLIAPGGAVIVEVFEVPGVSQRPGWRWYRGVITETP